MSRLSLSSSKRSVSSRSSTSSSTHSRGSSGFDYIKNLKRNCRKQHGLSQNLRISKSEVCVDCKHKVRKYGVCWQCISCRIYLCIVCYDKKSCPKGHSLTPVSTDKDIKCRGCNTVVIGGTRTMNCRICKFYICLGCYSGETCPGDHDLTLIRLKKKKQTCNNCFREFDLGSSIFGCTKCKYVLCGDCYHPSILLKQNPLNKNVNPLPPPRQQSLRSRLSTVQSGASVFDEKSESEAADSVAPPPSDSSVRSAALPPPPLGPSISEPLPYGSAPAPIPHGAPMPAPIPHGAPMPAPIPASLVGGLVPMPDPRAPLPDSTQELLRDIQGASIVASLSEPTPGGFMADTPGGDLDVAGLGPPMELVRLPSVMTECIICMETDRKVAFLPCGHYIACDECARECQTENVGCPICSKKIEDFLRIYS